MRTFRAAILALLATFIFVAQTGAVLYWGRPYDPNLQRWLQRDPIGERGGINVYGFVGNNPISRVDPYGLDFSLWSGGGTAYGNWTGNGANSVINAPVNGPGAAATASMIGASWLDKMFNTVLAVIGLTMQNPYDRNEQQMLDAIKQNAQQQLASPLARNGYYQPGSQYDNVGLGLALVTPVPFLKQCPAKSGFGDLTMEELNAIQKIVNETGTPITVVGSAARGERVFGSDIDYLFPIPEFPAPMTDVDAILPRLPGFDGLLIRGPLNTYEGPGMIFQKGANPVFVPGVR